MEHHVKHHVMAQGLAADFQVCDHRLCLQPGDGCVTSCTSHLLGSGQPFRVPLHRPPARLGTALQSSA
eukprot:1145033-Pelagomonas_calceolata.AAC.4